MNINRKRTRKRLLTKAKIKLARLNVLAERLQPPFYHYYEDYKESFLDRTIKYLLLKGGRGGVKSFSCVCFLVEESFNEININTLFLFAREIQTSTDESVYSLCKSMIEQAHLSEFFLVLRAKIVNKITGVEFKFIGLRSTGGKTAFSQLNKVKGKFNIRYIFVDEAQDLTEDTIITLMPTVNRGSKVGIINKSWHPKPEDQELSKSRMFFAMNPNFEDDPIVKKIESLIDKQKNENEEITARILHRNIFDIPQEFQDPQLIEQAELERGEIYFDHVWLGAASHKISGYPFASIEQARIAKRFKVFTCFLDPSFKGGDYTALSFLGLLGSKLAVFGHVWHKSWNKVAKEACQLIKRYEPDTAYYEDNSLGTVPEDLFSDHGVVIKGHTSLGNKENRIFKVAAYSGSRMVLVTNLCNSEYIKQVVKYNEESEYDDGPDSLASAVIKSGFISDKMKF